jgi:hypothetical protein
MKEKKFYNIDIRYLKLVLNFFSSSLTTWPNKLEGLSLETLSSQVLEFVGKGRANHMKDLSDASFLGKLLVLPANVRLDWKVIARYKHSSLFGLVISNEGKTFYNIDIRYRCLKLVFFVTDEVA